MNRRTNLPLTPTFIDGLLLLTNAVPDASLVIDCANCGSDKFVMVGAHHDHMSSLTRRDATHRVRFSDLKATDMIMGTARKVRQTVMDMVETCQPQFVFIVQSSAVQLIGTDVDQIAEELEEELGLPVGVVPPKPLSGDWLDGFDAGLSVLARRVPMSAMGGSRYAVGVVGYLFERFEEDHQGNVREIRRLLAGLGLELVSTWLDGSTTAGLAEIGRAGTLIALPSGRRAAAIISRATGARVIETDAPLGLDGTVRWLRRLGAELGREVEAEVLIEGELDRIVPRLDKIVRTTFMNRSAVVLADSSHGVDLTRALSELGFRVRLLALLSRRKMSCERAIELLSAEGLQPEVLHDPSFVQLADRLVELSRSGEVDLVVGSGGGHDAAKPLGIPYLELQHPCYVRHALFDAPWLGFRGALWLADALFNRLNERDYLRF